jgi:hypothetical protein
MAKNNKTALINTAKSNFVVFFVLVGTAAYRLHAKISSLVTEENQETILLDSRELRGG